MQNNKKWMASRTKIVVCMGLAMIFVGFSMTKEREALLLIPIILIAYSMYSIAAQDAALDNNLKQFQMSQEEEEGTERETKYVIAFDGTKRLVYGCDTRISDGSCQYYIKVIDGKTGETLLQHGYGAEDPISGAAMIEAIETYISPNLKGNELLEEHKLSMAAQLPF